MPTDMSANISSAKFPDFFFPFESPYWTKGSFYRGFLAGFKFELRDRVNAGTTIANAKARIWEQVVTGPNKLDFLAAQF